MGYSSLLPFILPDLRGCSDDLVLRTLHQVGADFCRLTEVWRKTLTPIDLDEGELEYPLIPGIGETDPLIHRILEVKISDLTVSPEKYILVPPEGTDGYILVLDESLEPAEDVDAGLEVSVVLIPGLTQDVLPDAFLARWGSAIVAGTLGALLQYDPARYSWGDLERAAIQLRQYDTHRAEARRERYAAGKSVIHNAPLAQGWSP